ncbi:TRAP transporter large permease [Marinobacterium rhizophilum]|uniref:TRAP transporter large permease protein n=1 Tax=Marinobacterium rhizophilum TaxID=420402 RepID=A0ABY5HG05_9GAMM|nr:TRAP transporter large permease [Marinobacterium rhizophilum]UTW11296.1 TRAP transporter large permease [Marinobacterium rhizophilum]
MLMLCVALLALTLLLIGAQMYIVLGVTMLVSAQLFFPALPNLVVVQKMVGGINQSALLAIPFFILAGEIMARGRIAAALTGVVQSFIGHYRGGMGYTTTGSCLVFGAVSGSAPATVAALGKILHPKLTAQGVDPRFATGLILASSELSLLVPPSITLIIYGWLTGTSIADLFVAGLAVGLVMAAALCLVVKIKSRSLVSEVRASAAVRARALLDALLPLGLPVIIIGGIYSGMMTATEAAAVAVVYALLVEVLLTRALTLADVVKITESAALITIALFLLLAAGSFIGYLTALAGLPALVTGLVSAVDAGPLLFLLIVNLVFLVAGMFLDPVTIQVILVPVLAPVAMLLGIDPVHFGMIVVMNIAISMITPPFGLDIFVASSILNVRVGEVIRSLVPFLLMNLLALAVVTYAPRFI